MWCYLYLGLIFKVLLFSISMERLIDQQFESPYCCPGRITRSLGKAGICWSAGCNKLSCSLVSHLRDASRCQLLWAVYFPDTHSAVNIFLLCIWKFSFHVGRELVGSKSQTPNSLVFAVRSYYHLHHYFIDFSMFFMLLLFITSMFQSNLFEDGRGAMHSACFLQWGGVHAWSSDELLWYHALCTNPWRQTFLSSTRCCIIFHMLSFGNSILVLILFKSVCNTEIMLIFVIAAVCFLQSLNICKRELVYCLQ